MNIDITSLPLDPGVYLFKDDYDRILYVGKARQLRRRLSAYFCTDKTHLSPKTKAMLRLAKSIDILCTTTEKEALLLEASLIKKHHPRYNIVLRDDKKYVVFKLDKTSAWPRLILTRRVVRDGSTYYGPFTSTASARNAWKAIHRVFPLRRCSDRAFANRIQPCLYHGLALCPAPCVLPVDQKAYNKLVHRVELLLTGRTGELVRTIKGEMQAAADSMAFELAAQLRNQIKAVQDTMEQQAAVLQCRGNMDVAAIVEVENGLGLGLLFVRQGCLLGKRNFFWPGLSLETGPEVLFYFLTQFYTQERFIPHRILVPWNFKHLTTTADPRTTDTSKQKLMKIIAIPDNPAASTDPPATVTAELAELNIVTLTNVLAERAGHPVRIMQSTSKVEKRLLAIARANAKNAAKECKQPPIIDLLAACLAMPTPPTRIEAVDVAHHQRQATYAGVVVYEHGRPARNQYRQYAFPNAKQFAKTDADKKADSRESEMHDIDQIPGDDCAVLAAWAKRRLILGPPWPDLLLIDGGKGQLRAVERIFRKSTDKSNTTENAPPPIFLAAIAKGKTGHIHSQCDSIFLPDCKNPLKLAPDSPELLFLQQVRDAAHAFVTGRHRQARRKALITRTLQGLPGIGQKTARLLWNKFPSLKAMSAATTEDLIAIHGIGKTRSQLLSTALHSLASTTRES